MSHEVDVCNIDVRGMMCEGQRSSFSVTLYLIIIIETWFFFWTWSLSWLDCLGDKLLSSLSTSHSRGCKLVQSLLAFLWLRSSPPAYSASTSLACLSPSLDCQQWEYNITDFILVFGMFKILIFQHVLIFISLSQIIGEWIFQRGKIWESSWMLH